ncbi:MFS transporter [Nonomuraea sp. NN258]|nr:MFS transporter [Nonomuraea antri]
MRLLRHRPVLVLWLAETLSVFGDRFFTLALTWTAWQKSGAVAMGLVVVAEYVPHILIGAFGKRLIARFASFRALARVEFAQVAVVGAMPWLWESIGLAGVLVVLLLIGTADAITNPSLSSLVPDLAPADQVRPVVGLMNLTQQLTWVLGPGSAAVLLVWMPAEHLFLLDASTFLVSGCAFVWLARWVTNGASRLGQASEQVQEAAQEEARGRVRARTILRARPRLALALSLSSLGEFCATVATIGLPIWITSRLHAGPAAYGMVLTAMGAGALAGNLLSSLPKLAGFPTGYCLTWAARGALLATYAVTDQVWQVVAVTVLASLLTPVNAVTLTERISRLPGPERLRIFSVELTGLHVAGMGSMLVLPAFIAAAPGPAFVAAGTVVACGGLLAWLLCSVRADAATAVETAGAGARA